MSRLNDGSRPSRLQIGRALSGEAPLSPEAEAHPATAEWRALVAAAAPPPFDAEAIRARAAALPAGEAPRGQLISLFRRSGPWIAGGFALAAGLFFALKPPPRANRLKGADVELGFDLRRDGQAFPGDATMPVRAGDSIRFDYTAGTAGSVVLVGVDGTGTVQTYWPEIGETPVSIAPGQGVLEGSILLDDAPGPEVFVASFSGESSGVVAREVRAAYASGGVSAVLALDAERADIAVLVLDKE